MPDELGAKLAAFGKDRMGDDLRSVVVLYQDEFHPLYLRDDLEDEYDRNGLDEVLDSFRIPLDIFDADVPDASIGSKRSITHHHESAYVFQFPYENCHSILMSFSPEVGRQLRAFLAECERRIG